MKRFLLLFLSVLLAAGCFAACGDNYSEEAVVVDYENITGTGTPYVFGMCNNGDSQTVKHVQKEFDQIGITWVRKSFWFDRMLPLEVVPSIEDWKNNTNDCRNPDYWLSNHLDTLLNAKKSGDKVMMIICYTPPFLSYNGKESGVPKDWDIFEEIIRIAVEKYKDYIDMYEIWNEYGDDKYLDITGSPYKDKHTAYQDIYLHSVKAIREVVPDAIVGGCATAMGGQTREIESLLNNPEFTPESNLLNFVSFHEYTDNDITFSVEKYRELLEAKGFKDIPIYIDEWNSSQRGELYATKFGISYIGKTLVSFMRKNVGGAFYSAGTISGGGYNEDFGIFDYFPEENRAYFKPIVNAFKVAGARLGLSNGYFKVAETAKGNTTDSIGAINSDGKYVLFLVNDTNEAISTPVVLKNLSYDGKPVVKAYTASNLDSGDQGTELECEYRSKKITATVEIPAYGVVGVVVDDDFEYVPEEEPETVIPTEPTILNPGFEDGYDGWINSGSSVMSNAHSGKQSTMVTAGKSAEQVILGLKPNATYKLSAYVKAVKGGIASLGAKESGLKEYNSVYDGEEYKQISVEFSTGPENKSAKIYIYNYAEKGAVYADDFTIETISENNPVITDIGENDTALIKNGGFELGNAEIYEGGVKINKGGANKGEYCGELLSGKSASQKVALKPNTSYTFTAYIKTDITEDGGNKISLVVKNYNNGPDIYVPATFSKNYTVTIVEFVTGDNAEEVELSVWNPTSATAYVDDILLVETQ